MTESNSRQQTLEREKPDASAVASAMNKRDLADPPTSRRRKRSNKTMINFWLDAGMLVLFVALGIVAVIVHFVFPPGVAARGWTLWGMTYGQWCSVQFIMLCAMALAVLVHVMLHWPWICGVIWRQLLGRSRLPDDGVRTLVGVGLLIVLLNVAGIAVAIAKFTIATPAEP